MLFVSSGNDLLTFPIAVYQGDSIAKSDQSIKIEHFRVKGKGARGYIKNIFKLRQHIKNFKPDIIHSHYSFCGYLSVLAMPGVPIVHSLMGSDVQQKGILKLTTRFFSLFWPVIIVKSEDMKIKCGIKRAVVIPNGVDLDNFAEISKAEAKKKLDLLPDKRYVLFLADTSRPEKNFELAVAGFEKIKTDELVLLAKNHVSHDQVRFYYYAADVVLLTSLYEGSPNVIKEAMACNKTIVTTRVGDVEKIVSGVEGCFICDSTAEAVGRALSLALEYKLPTRGREKLLALKIDAGSVAAEIIKKYKTLINPRRKESID